MMQSATSHSHCFFNYTFAVSSKAVASASSCLVSMSISKLLKGDLVSIVVVASTPDMQAERQESERTRTRTL